MKALTRYIGRQTVAATLMMTTALTLIIWLMQSLRFIDYIVNKNMPISHFLGLVALLLPALLSLVLPISFFIAIIFIFNKLHGDSELVVMRASGYSAWGLARPVIGCGIGLVAILYAITLYFLPVSYQSFKEWQNELRNEFASIVLKEGVFQELFGGVTVFIRERTREGELAGILLHDNRNAESPQTWMAENGAWVITDSGPKVVLLNGNVQQVNRATGQLSLIDFDEYTIDLTTKKETKGPRATDPHEVFLPQLLSPPENLGERMQGKYRSELHSRLVVPISAISMCFIALMVILTGQFNRRGMGGRILLCALFAVIYKVIEMTLVNMVAKQPIVMPLIYVNLFFPILCGIFVLRQGQRMKILMPRPKLIAVE